MAVRAACANGNLTSASTWETCDSTSYSNSESANTALTTSQVSSSTFTPGAITIDGIGVKLASRAASPSGTITVQLTQGGSLVTGTNVTINVSDLPTCTATSGSTTPTYTAEGGWVFFKFAAPVTLAGATAYAVSAATSVGSQVNLWSAATTNWSRYLRTTTTGAPAAGDDLIITGEWTAAATVTARTVTMDNTNSTAFGSNTTSQVTPAISICIDGTLSFGTSASTNYQLVVKGYVIIYNGGTFNAGTSGTPVPNTSTATFQQTCTADGDFGIIPRNGGTFTSNGAPRTTGKLVIETFLTVNLSAAGTSATVNDDTGWLNGDVVVLPSTDQTYTHAEKLTLNANATSSGLSFSAGAANAHSGTTPTQCEVGLLTRNVVFTGGSTTVQPFIACGPTSTVNLQWTEFNEYGTGNAASSSTTKLAFNINNGSGGSFNMQYCSIHDARGTAISINGTAAASIINVDHTVLYNNNTANTINGHGINMNAGAAATTNYWVFDHVYVLSHNAGSNTASGINCPSISGKITNSVIASTGSTNAGAVQLGLSGSSVTTFPVGAFDHLTIHSNNGLGLNLINGNFGLVTNSNIWRNAGNGVQLSGTNGPTTNTLQAQGLQNCNLFGNSSNTSSGDQVAGGGASAAGNYLFDNCLFGGDTTFSASSANAISIIAPGVRIRFLTCNFAPSGTSIYTNCGNDLNMGNAEGVVDILFDNCIMRSGNPVLTNTGSYTGPICSFQNYNQVANDNRTYYNHDGRGSGGGGNQAIIQTNTSTVYGTNTRSEQMTPNNFSVSKFISAPIYVACPSGKAATPIVQVQKNSSYNGNAPRLILQRQDSMGITADTVIATFSAGANTWQGLTGTTAAAPQDGIFCFVVDCDGTASGGSIFVGDATATVA